MENPFHQESEQHTAGASPKRKSRANVQFSGQNGKQRRFNPVMRPLACKRQRKAKRARHSRAARVARRSVAG